MPWSYTASCKGYTESVGDVRPIFWAHRPRSYLERTATWDEYPKGRWGKIESPAFSVVDEHYLTKMYTPSKKQRREKLGCPDTVTVRGRDSDLELEATSESWIPIQGIVDRIGSHNCWRSESLGRSPSRLKQRMRWQNAERKIISVVTFLLFL
eukprot:GCRY01008647.1.p1 GENE.GCRY01008647.1~~GCRY01008647.1.p1  ORF type:complete len:153 (+),score=18.73 GCRY01008647.1:991-1449(+)